MVSIIAAMSKDGRAVGSKNTLLWHLPEDLKRFKAITLGCPVILGRKTFESIVDILGKPLPGRTNIVVTRNTDWSYPDPSVIVAHSFEEALIKAKEFGNKEIFVGGGPDIWKQSLPHVDKLYLTFVEDEPEADAFFPEFEGEFVKVSEEEAREEGGIRYQWVTYERK